MGKVGARVPEVGRGREVRDASKSILTMPVWEPAKRRYEAKESQNVRRNGRLERLEEEAYYQMDAGDPACPSGAHGQEYGEGNGVGCARRRTRQESGTVPGHTGPFLRDELVKFIESVKLERTRPARALPLLTSFDQSHFWFGRSAYGARGHTPTLSLSLPLSLPGSPTLDLVTEQKRSITVNRAST